MDNDKVIIKNLYAKQLIENDLIVEIEQVEHYRFGPIARFTVERTRSAHEADRAKRKLIAEQDEIAQQQAALEAESHGA